MKGMLGEEGEHMMEMEGAEKMDRPAKPNVAKARKHLMMALECLMGDKDESDADY